MLGLYVSDHPLMGAAKLLARFADCGIAFGSTFSLMARLSTSASSGPSTQCRRGRKRQIR